MTVKKIKNLTIIFLSIALIFMSIAFALLSTNLTISGTASVTGTWNVKFNDAEYIEDNVLNPVNEGSNIRYELYNNNESASVSFKLLKPSDFVKYRFEIKNFGSISAKLVDIESLLDDDSYIERTIVFQNLEGNEIDDVLGNLVLNQDESVYAVVTYKYKDTIGDEDDTTELPSTDYLTTDNISFIFEQN